MSVGDRNGGEAEILSVSIRGSVAAKLSVRRCCEADSGANVPKCVDAVEKARLYWRSTIKRKIRKS